ncbi:hypothetical protein [Ketobacter alkanivorans]|uniref:Lipoprotein n=1 Tax=Ketobacter alkanivorans TaxID=1917421 RepID=A0A2K9LIK3_9GAMM|nr:hypothetical protein [Ketobacter alkanivorans]AUM12011.1 hypothetical protein Kalk_06060 [Ketobacter alkanivorans]
MNNKTTLGLFALILGTFFMQGCTIYWSGSIDNKSGMNISVSGDDAKKTTWKISTDETVEITWKFKCLEISESGDAYFFDAQNAPKGALRMEGITYTVYTLYREHQLYYQLEDGTVQALPKLESCPAA